MKRSLGLFLALLFTACRSATPLPAPNAAAIAPAARPIVILVSIDGFRHDYFERFHPPTLVGLAKTGVRSEGLIPQFPSKTFPNHYTIVTGLRFSHHGIVSNNMTAPDIPGRFSMSNRDAVRDARWWGGEPIWNTAERQGRVAAAMFWPGSEAPINGRYASYWVPFDDAMPHRARVDQILAWLRLPEDRRPSLLTLYFSDVDNAGHDVGPDAPNRTEVRDAVMKVDASLGEVVAGVEKLGLASRVNYVVVSDHGMSQLSPDRLIRLDDYIDTAKFDVLDAGPVLAISPKDGDVEGLYRALNGRHPRMHVYRKADIPKRFHLDNHPRVQPIVAIADDGWYITSKNEMERWAKSGSMAGGTHGYDPRLSSMHALFIASGPRIRNEGRVVKPFENIHVYDFLCALLGISPAPNDGDAKVTAGFLR